MNAPAHRRRRRRPDWRSVLYCTGTRHIHALRTHFLVQQATHSYSSLVSCALHHVESRICRRFWPPFDNHIDFMADISTIRNRSQLAFSMERIHKSQKYHREPHIVMGGQWERIDSICASTVMRIDRIYLQFIS